MNPDIFERICLSELSPEALEESCAYLTEKLKQFVYKQEPVLVCFPDEGPASLGGIFGEAVRRCEAKPVFLGGSYRWKELLYLAFDSHSQVIIAHPTVVLGLMKLSKYTKTPLYIHNAVLTCYPYSRWMVQGLKKGLDCKVWGCYNLRNSPVIAGFTCDEDAGIHVRQEVFRADVVDEGGKPMPDSRRGKLLFHYLKEDVVFDPEETALLRHQECSCGNDAPRIVESVYSGSGDTTKRIWEERFLAWSSVLDYRARQTESGIDLELVVFPGECLPKLPSCAKLTVRPWEPERDVPFYIADHFVKISENLPTNP